MFKALGGNTNQYICSSTDIRHVHPTKNILDKQYLRPMQVCLLAILIQCYRILCNYSPIVNSFEVASRTRGGSLLLVINDRRLLSSPSELSS